MIPAGENGACVAEYSLPADRPRIERRFLPVIKEGIPDELKALDRWVLWRATFRNGKTTKVPYSIDGQKAKSNDPRTWTTFDLAYAEYEAGRADGIGFNFSVDDDILGIDLDDCVCEDGMIKPQAMKIVEILDSFTEYSVSGKGLHVICRAPLEKGVRKGPCEVYPFDLFTVTGARIRRADRTKEKRFRVKATVAQMKPPIGATHRKGRSYFCNKRPSEKARNAANGPKFRRLFDDCDISSINLTVKPPRSAL
jgi:putative DNA primase/helicase